MPVVEGDTIGPELNRQASYAKYRIGSKDSHSEHAIWVADERKPTYTPLEGENVDMHWPKHAVPGTLGFELIAGLPHPKDYDFFVWKGVEPDMHPYGLCYHDHAERLTTGVIEFLKNHAVDTIILGGLALDYCVKISALQLVKAGFRVIVNLAATKPLAQESATLAVEAMQTAGVVFIESSNDLELEDD